MEIILYAQTTVGFNGGNDLVDGAKYALVAMTLSSFKPTTGKNAGKELKFYVPVLAAIGEGNAILSVFTVQRGELTRIRIGRYDAEARNYRNNSGDYVDGVENIIKAHNGDLVDLVWLRDVLSTIRGEVFTAKVDYFRSRSRSGNEYNAHVNTLTKSGEKLNLNDVNTQNAIKAAAAAAKIDIVGLIPSEPLTFKRENGEAIA